MNAPNIIDIIAENANQIPQYKNSTPIFIVVHYLGVANADNPYLYGGGYGGHFYVSRAGQIYQAADPVHHVVWQCGGCRQGYDPGSGSFFGVCTNYNSIGIECGVNYDGTWFFTTETQNSLVELVKYLMEKYNISEDHVIRHWDVTGKHCPAPYVENNHYRTNWTWDEFKQKLKEQKGEDEMITEIFSKVRMKEGSNTYKQKTVKVSEGGSLNVRVAPDSNAPKNPVWPCLHKGDGVIEVCKMTNGWSCVIIWAGKGTGTVGFVNGKYLK